MFFFNSQICDHETHLNPSADFMKRLFTSSSFCFWTELLPVLCQRTDISLSTNAAGHLSETQSSVRETTCRNPGCDRVQCPAPWAAWGASAAAYRKHYGLHFLLNVTWSESVCWLQSSRWSESLFKSSSSSTAVTTSRSEETVWNSQRKKSRVSLRRRRRRRSTSSFFRSGESLVSSPSVIVMASAALELMGFFMGLLGLLGTLVATVLPYWQISAHIGSPSARPWAWSACGACGWSACPRAPGSSSARPTTTCRPSPPTCRPPAPSWSSPSSCPSLQ